MNTRTPLDSTPTDKATEGRKPSRKERAEETRARLVESAIALFSERGYHETTVQSISERAGVAKGTFFVHFVTKDALLLGVLAEYISSAERARDESLAHGANPEETISAIFAAHAEQFGRSSPFMRACYSATLASHDLAKATNELFELVRKMLVAEIARGQSTGKFRADISPVEAALAISSLYIGVSLSYSMMTNAPPLKTMFQPMLELAMKSFCPRATAH